jgi:thioredoxin reductase (NADPH)
MYEVAIIGAGPAGASAALFTAKAGKKTIVIDSDKGMTKRAWFENYYGIDEISGPQLIDIGIKQFQKFGAEYKQAIATAIKQSAEELQVTLDSGETVVAKHVILASGIHVDLAEQLGLTTKPGTEPRIKTIVDVDHQGKTNIAGVWAAGTITGVSVHAVITAGDGAKVAINVISELNGERYVDHDLLK